MLPDNGPEAMPSPGRRILVLATDAHGGYGGIAQYNRDVLEGLATADTIEEIVVIPRLVQEPPGQYHEKVHYIWNSVNGKPQYIKEAIRSGLLGKKFDLIYCAHINLMPLALAVGKARKVPIILAIYGIEAWHPPKNSMTRWAANKADMVISISRVTLNRYLAWAGAHPSTRIVPNAIHLDQYAAGPRCPELARELGLGSGPVIMTFGRMASGERYKGFDEILNILPNLLKTFPDLRYIAAGDGTDRSRLEIKARDLGVSNAVVFAGRVEEARKADYFRLADAYVMPSQGEGFGFVVLEALACGIPVVASTTDGTFEAVREGRLGIAVDPKDSETLTAAVFASLERSKGVPFELEYFSFSNFARRVHAAVGDLVG